MPNVAKAPKQYVSRCRRCGQIGIRAFGTTTGGKPAKTPMVMGKCKVSTNGIHSPTWEKA